MERWKNGLMIAEQNGHFGLWKKCNAKLTQCLTLKTQPSGLHQFPSFQYSSIPSFRIPMGCYWVHYVMFLRYTVFGQWSLSKLPLIVTERRSDRPKPDPPAVSACAEKSHPEKWSGPFARLPPNETDVEPAWAAPLCPPYQYKSRFSCHRLYHLPSFMSIT